MISINWPTGVITVPKADMTLVSSSPIEIRELNINTFRTTLNDLQDDEEGQVWPTTHNHNTVVEVGGVTLARVVEIINGYTVTFENGSYAVNLVGANSNIADVVNLNTVSVRAANSAGLVQLAQLDSIKYQIEALNRTHRGYGRTFYLDPINGTDGNSGTEPGSAKRTFAGALALCESGRNDAVYVKNDSGSSVVIDEVITLDKDAVHLRGPGTSVTIQPSTDTNDTVTINADDCSVSGFIINTKATGTARQAIYGTSTSSRIKISGVNIEKSTGIGIKLDGGNRNLIENTNVQSCASDGIYILDNIDLLISNVGVEVCGGWAIQVMSTSSSVKSKYVRLSNVMTHHNGPGALNIGANSNMTIIDRTCYFALDSGADVVVNAGSGTHNDLDEYRNRIKEIVVPAVWNEAIAGHLTAGTTGKALSDAGSAGNPWGSPIAGNTDAGTFGELVGKKLLTIAKFLGLK